MRIVRFWLWSSIFLLGVAVLPASAQLREFAWYRLGETDPGAAAGADVEASLDVLDVDEVRPMTTFGTVTYSSDTPPGISSTLSVAFDGEADNYLSTTATPWQNLIPGSFRVGMEAFIKPDPSMEGLASVPFGNGTGYHLGIDQDGYFHAYGFGETPASKTKARFGEWQHVAFWTTGSYWQIYVDGVPQYDTSFGVMNYGSPGGLATIGADKDGFSEYTGLVDEQRVFTWAGAFNPANLLFFTLRNEGDVNEDGLRRCRPTTTSGGRMSAPLPAGLTLLQGRALGDLDGNRQVNLDDFALIKANKSPGAVLVIPEPATATLLWLGVGLAAMTWRRRGR